MAQCQLQVLSVLLDPVNLPPLPCIGTHNTTRDTTVAQQLMNQLSCTICNMRADSHRPISRSCPAVAPPGYFVASPGKVAPCAQGEYKAAYANSASCTELCGWCDHKDQGIHRTECINAKCSSLDTTPPPCLPLMQPLHHTDLHVPTGETAQCKVPVSCVITQCTA